MAGGELFTRLPRVIQEVTDAEEVQNECDFVKELVISSLPKQDLSSVDDELRRNFAIHKFRILKKKQCSQQKKKQLSLNEKRELGLYKINKKGMKYVDFLPLHQLWKQYIRSYLDLNELEQRGFTGDPAVPQWTQFSQLLSKADFHGASVEVMKSKCTSLVGHSGIVILDAKNTFKIIGTNNIVKTIPKEPAIFSVTLDDFSFTIYGKYFCVRPPERSVKKIRSQMMLDL